MAAILRPLVTVLCTSGDRVSSNLENLEYSGKTWKTRGIFLPVYENFLYGLLFELFPDNNRKIICKNNDCI